MFPPSASCFPFPISIGLTPSTWRHLLPVAMTLWQFLMDRTPCRPCWGNSVVQCSHPICAPLPTSYLLSSGQMPQWMGLAGEPPTVRHLVGVCFVFVMPFENGFFCPAAILAHNKLKTKEMYVENVVLRFWLLWLYVFLLGLSKLAR